MTVVFVTRFVEFASYTDIIRYLMPKEILKCTESHLQSNL